MEFYHEKKLDNIDYVSRIQPKILNHQTISYLIFNHKKIGNKYDRFQ